MRRLIAGSHRKGEKVTTYTIEDASFVVSEMNFAQIILLHVGINNLKSQPAEEVLSQFSNLVNLARTKSGNVVISLPILHFRLVSIFSDILLLLPGIVHNQ